MGTCPIPSLSLANILPLLPFLSFCFQLPDELLGAPAAPTGNGRKVHSAQEQFGEEDEDDLDDQPSSPAPGDGKEVDLLDE